MVRRALAGVTFARSLPGTCAEDWHRATHHRFVSAVADGTLPRERWHLWLQQDHRFVEGLRGVVRDLLTIAPYDDRPGLEAALSALEPELDMFRAAARTEGITLAVAPLPVCTEYVGFLRSCVADGYAAGLTAYYGCERAYFDAWTTVPSGSVAEVYRSWVENWTSPAFGAFVDHLADRLDMIAMGIPDTAPLVELFGRTVRFEAGFWDACLA